MMFTEISRKFAAGLVMAGMLASQSGLVLAAGPRPTAAPSQQAAQVGDVALGQGGVLRGQVIGTEGAEQAGVAVSISQNGEPLVRVTTDRDGRFAARGLKGGVYLVSTEGAAGVIRAWAPQTAPPSAAPAIMLVPGSETLRGQNGALMYQLLCNPAVWVVGGAMGTILVLAIDEAS